MAMLQDAPTIRQYQRLTDAFTDLSKRGYRYDDLRMYLDGYIAALRHSNVLEAYQIHRLEEETMRYLRDPSNFETPESEFDYY